MIYQFITLNKIIRTECWCGNTLKYGYIPSTSCNFVAPGSNDTRGGPFALSVYPAAYIGCYQDAFNGRSYSLDGYSYTSDKMTAVACVSACAGRGYLYAGIEAGSVRLLKYSIQLTKGTFSFI
jgi:hypothetical protein